MENYNGLDKELYDLARELSINIKKSKLTLSFAESCTGGLAARGITQHEGASDFFLGSIVAYSNKLKCKILKVKKDTLERYGAESIECAKEMLAGVKSVIGSDICAVATGVAGPGDYKGIKAGTVFFGFSFNGKEKFEEIVFWGNRNEVIKKAVIYLYGKLILIIK